MSSPDPLKLARAAALSALLLLASGQALAQATDDDEDEDPFKGRPTTLSFGAFGDSEKSFSFDGTLTLPVRERFTVDAGMFYNRAEGDPTEVALSTVGAVAGVTYQLFDRWDVGGSVRWFGRGGQVRTAEGALKAGFAPTEAWHFSAGGLYRNTTLTVNIDLPLPFNDIRRCRSCDSCRRHRAGSKAAASCSRVPTCCGSRTSLCAAFAATASA